ncbi:MAG: single-stranded DNA-binding protein [Actinomycetota bacterium]|nr:single-stranded DNA-binding protein [Actinomycetota bacterium]
MASINHAVLGGNLTADPELKTIVTREGEEILAAEARVAVTRKGSKKGSEKKDYFTFTCYRQAAENLAEYRGKGDAVIVTGEARHQRWAAEDGSPRSRHVFPARSIQYVDSAGRGVNSGVLAGNITRDPEMRYARVGDDMVPVTTFGLAVNRVRSDDPVDAVDFFDVVCWRGLAEVVANNKLKGDGVLVEGRFRLDQWKNDADESRQKVVFVADEVQFTTLPPEEGEAVAADEAEGFEEEDFDEIDDLEEEEAPVARAASGSAARSNNPRRSTRDGSGYSARRGAARRATRTAGARR